MPDPVLSPADGPTPEQEALLADSVGLAMLVVLDTLTPAERVAFVLHDVFDVPFGEIAPMLGRTPEASRQLASRARQRVRTAGTHQPDGTLAAQRAVIDAFFAAARAGDLATLVELLDPDVVLRTDGFVAGSALLRGADAVARATLGGAHPQAEFRPVVVNGVAGVLITLRGRPAGLMAFTIVGRPDHRGRRHHRPAPAAPPGGRPRPDRRRQRRSDQPDAPVSRTPRISRRWGTAASRAVSPPSPAAGRRARGRGCC